MSIVKLLIPKEGNTDEECEDSLNYRGEENKLFVSAVADGASQGYESKLFSELLCTNFVEKFKEIRVFEEVALREKFESFIAEVREKFDNKIKEKTKDKVIKWYEENAIETGAFSTFLGLLLNIESKEGYFIGVGDCFLFHLKNTKTENQDESQDLVVNIYPEKYIDQSNTPYLLATKSRYNSKLSEHLYQSPLTIENGDTLILSTDAFSYFMIDSIDNKDLIRTIAEKHEESLKQIIDHSRKNGKLKNDDVAVIRFRNE